MGVRAQAPVANFSASPTAGCGPLVVTFKDLSSGKPLFWTWDFGNGQISSQQNPTTRYSTPGVYTVSLIVKNTSGSNAIRMTDYITVYPFPQAGFTSNLTLACAPANISFSDQSTPGQGSITSWSWNFGDGTTSNQQSPSHSYAQPGYYNVSFQVTNTLGCSNVITRTRYLRIVSGIEPDFKWTQTSASCSTPFTLNFTNQTAGPGNLTYTWDFGNGNGSAQVNPSSITYPANLDYTVSLTAQSDLGCGGTTKKTVSFPVAIPKITAPDSVCNNSPASFQNSSSPAPLSTRWDFGDGTGATTPIASKTYTVPGTYQVKVVNTHTTCTDSVIKSFKVIDNPVADFKAVRTDSCNAPFTARFQDLTAGATGWQWDFGDGGTSTQQNPSHTYTTVGSFKVTLTATNAIGCSGFVSKPDFIKVSTPKATLTNQINGEGCSNINFTYSPTLALDVLEGVASYSWNATGAVPNTSTSPTPSFVYNTAGDYDIVLTLLSNDGCSVPITFTNAVKVGDPVIPAIIIAPTDACAQHPVTFTSTATPADHWYWGFGDGGTSQDMDIVQHTYTDTGYHDVTLRLVNHGCSQTKTFPQAIHVNPPVANFGFTTNCINKLSVAFSDTSITDQTTTTTYLLDYGDGTNSGIITGPTYPPIYPTHVYPAFGIYTATLSVTNGICTGMRSRVLNLNTLVPVISAPDSICRGSIFTLGVTGIDPTFISNYAWQTDYGSASGPDPTYSIRLSTNGPSILNLTVTDINGCPYTAIPRTVFVTGPTAKFTVVPGGCKNSPIPFTDASTTDGTYALATWQWDFGDGTGGLLPPPFLHSYADTGVYSVLMAVTDTKGCSDTYQLSNIVQVTSPKAGFFITDSFYCPNAPLTFTDTSKGYNLSTLWDFGDGSTPSTMPVHPFPTSGQHYSVKLKVTDQVGCSDSVTRSNYVFIQKPISAFSIDDSTTICPPLQTTFTPNPQYYDSLYWDFGDGTTSTLASTSHFYNTYDTFYAKLILRGPGGCLDTAIRRIFVLNPGLSTFTYSPVKDCDSVLTNFTIKPPGFTYFAVFFGDNKADSSNRGSFSHLYRLPSTYQPQLFLQDSTGCIVAIGGSNFVTVLGATPFFSMDPHAFCDSGTVNFNDFTTTNDPILSRTWDFGDGTPPFTQPDPTVDLSFSHDFKVPGTLTPTLKITTQNNCAESYTDTLHIHQTPHPVITVIDPTCATEPIRIQGDLTTPNVDPVTWLWNFGNGKTSGEQNPTIVYPASTSLRISLRTSVPYGCSDTISQLLDIHALPTVKGPPEISTPVGFPVTIPFTYSSGVIDYSWKPATHLSCTDCSNPIADPKFSTLYVVTLTDSNNCKISDSILVKTVCNDKNYFVPNTFSPNGDGVNDIFYPRGTNLYNIQSMRVFNRWGQLVFERRNFPSNSPSDGWDGRFNGRPAPGDAYVYIMEVICDNSQVVALRGDVTLIR